MRKITLLIVFAFIISAISFAQGDGNAPLGKGGKQINFGVGFIDGIPLYVGVDFGVHRDVSLGPEIDFDLSGFDWMRIKFRADYHWNSLIGIPSEWDFYSGVGLGPKIRLDNNDNNNNNDVGFLFQVNIGGRWYWSDWGINSEFGLGTDINWRFGLSKRF
jgi:hypothetical protein